MKSNLINIKHLIRNLRKDENVTNGIAPKNIEANYTIAGFAARGTDLDSQFIPTTTSPTVANKWFENECMAIIDVEKLLQYIPPEAIYDLSSTEKIKSRNLRLGKLAENFLLASKEVDFERVIIPPDCFIIVRRQEFERMKFEYVDQYDWPKNLKDAAWKDYEDSDQKIRMIEELYLYHTNEKNQKLVQNVAKWEKSHEEARNEMVKLKNLYEQKHLIEPNQKQKAFVDLIWIAEEKLKDLHSMPENIFMGYNDFIKKYLGPDAKNHIKYRSQYIKNMDMQKEK